VKVGEKTPTQLGPLEKANLNHQWRRVFWNTGRWKKSRKILYNIHHRQKPLKSM
jgi:hypothetical protein